MDEVRKEKIAPPQAEKKKGEAKNRADLPAETSAQAGGAEKRTRKRKS
ncbi:hypothetical protein KAI65_01680 [Candidatus Parcubacteria bacterium]|nr:hypothetical protein [Candidatus Parcubacteria bacterium]